MPDKNFQDNLKNALDDNKAFVAYRWPNSKRLELLIQEDDTLHFSDNLSAMGFVFASSSQQEKTIIIPFDRAKKTSYNTDNSPFADSLSKGYERKKSSLSKEKYINLIEKAVSVINSEEIDKVVLSRKITVIPKEFESKEVFIRLLLKYPNACVYLWHHPKVGTWLGATPEKLLNLKNNKLETMALAGTQKSNNGGISWGLKERKEQQWVTDFITHTLSQIAIPFKISQPYNLKAGHLWHICTDILGELPENISLEKVVKALHPTPAVAGLPRLKAIDFINKNETYNRSFYTGFLGIINQEKEGVRISRLFVNLRCMQIEGYKASIYVGGGITKESNPLSEWNETEAKSETLLEVL